MNLPTLVTIGVSHFCEKARWGLDRAKVPYCEERHAPGFHLLAVRRAGGKRGTPILVAGTDIIGDSTDILLWANDRAATGYQLYPEDPTVRAVVLALEDRFDQDLGPHVRRAIYYGLLPDPDLMIPLMSHGVPRYERVLLPLIYRPLCRLMRSAMRIDAAGAQRSHEKVMGIMDFVSEKLADGRPFLMGDQFGAADITFASLAAPAVFAPGYAVPLPSMLALAPATAAFVRAVRATRAGAFCLRLYREQRR